MYSTDISHQYLSSLNLPPVVSHSYHTPSPQTTNNDTSSSSKTSSFTTNSTTNTAYTSTTGQADGSSGYGNESLSSDIHTESTAPEKFKYKFNYYFKNYPDKLRSKLKMDEIASFSVTEAGFAEEITQLILSHIPNSKRNGDSPKIIDATACVGGNSMSFLQHFGTVYAIELDPVRKEMLAWNLGLCKKIMQKELNKGKLAAVRAFQGDFLQLMLNNSEPVSMMMASGHCDVIFLDPPWGGRAYGEEEKVTLSLGSRRMYEICNEIRTSTKYTVLKLPKNYDVDFLESKLHSTCQIDLIKNLQNNRGIVKMKIIIIKNNNTAATTSISTSSSSIHTSSSSSSSTSSSSSSSPSSSANVFLPTVNVPISSSTTTTIVQQTAWNNKEAMKLFLKESKKPQVRGIYAFGDEPSVAWRSATSCFPNPGCPNFTTKQECIAWCKHVRGTPSNPDHSHLQHLCTVLIGWNQVDEYLLQKRDEYLRRYPKNNNNNNNNNPVNGGRYSLITSIRNATKARLLSSPHRSITPSSVINTLKYLYFHMRSGLYVMIRNGQVQMFVPFVNDQYENTYNAQLSKFENGRTKKEYYNVKWNKYCRHENIIPDTKKWWANANILCNELGEDAEKINYWGDAHLAQLRDMLESMCNRALSKNQAIPDVEFFLNKRDHPQLKRNKTEPYDFIFDRSTTKGGEAAPTLERCNYNTYAPIFSYYCGDRFSDLPLPLSEDWSSATGTLYPETTQEKYNSRGELNEPKVNDLYFVDNFKKFYREWDKKRPTAFFRGNMTGAGTTRANGNQRMNLVSTMVDWDKAGTNKVQGHNLLDAKGTGWNVRDKMLNGEIVHPRKDHTEHNFKSGRFNFVPIYEQSEYKYIVYADGHSAANRYAFLMRLGCVVLRVASRKEQCAGHDMWFYPILKGFDPFSNNSNSTSSSSSSSSSTTNAFVSWNTSLLECHDHILIDEHLTNLRAVLEWCRNNDDVCRKLAENARKKHEHYLSKDGILDYLETTMIDISKRKGSSTSGGPFWWKEQGSRPLPIPSMSNVNGQMNWGTMTPENIQLAGDAVFVKNKKENNVNENKNKSVSVAASSSSSSSSSGLSSGSVATKRKAQQQITSDMMAALKKRRTT